MNIINEDNLEEFTQYILEGKTIKELQEIYNCTRTTITNAKKKFNLVGLSPNSKKRDNGNGTKTCNLCLEIKPVSEFYSNGYDTKGNKKLKPNCKNCEQKDLYKKFLIKINSICKELGIEYKCEICGYDKNYAALTFHHYSDEKNFEISSAKNISREKLLEEIILTQILCQNCHHETHNPNLSKDYF